MSSSGRVSLFVPGIPVPLQRSRTAGGRHYLPARSRAYREAVQAAWMLAGRPSLGRSLFSMSVQFHGARANADLDNLCKAVLDALNGLAFDDDSQLVCIAGAHKLAAGVAGPRAELTLWRAGEPAP